MRKIFQEPLVQFIILGLLLFAGHNVWASTYGDEKKIFVSTDTVERLKTIYAGEQSREPSNEDTNALIAAYIEEEALSREAEALGLGDDDTIIRRRLAQKMRFMTENVDKPEAPSDTVLKAWYDDNMAKFTQPTRITFQHIYFSPDNNSDLEGRAQSVLSEAKSGADWKTLGDPFIMSRSLTRVSQTDIGRSYGKAFGESIITLPAGDWSEPIESAYGLHLVKVLEREESRQPSFDEAKDRIRIAWQEEIVRTENARKVKAIVDSYAIEFEAPQ